MISEYKLSKWSSAFRLLSIITVDIVFHHKAGYVLHSTALICLDFHAIRELLQPLTNHQVKCLFQQVLLTGLFKNIKLSHIK